MSAWKQMIVPTILMGVVAIALTVIATSKGVHVEGYRKGWNIFYPLVPLLIFAFVVAGMVQVLLPEEWVTKWLGAEAGWKGILLGCVAGGLTPGGPFIQFPIVLGFWRAGVGIGVLVAYITAWSLWAVHRLPLEYGVLGGKFVLIRLASTIIFPPLAGFIAHWIFGRWGAPPG